MLIGSTDSWPKSALATFSVPDGAPAPEALAAAGAVVAAAAGAAAVVGLGAAAAAAVVAAAAGGVVGAGAGAPVGEAGVAAGPHAARILRLAAPNPTRRSTARLVHN